MATQDKELQRKRKIWTPRVLSIMSTAGAGWTRDLLALWNPSALAVFAVISMRKMVSDVAAN